MSHCSRSDGLLGGFGTIRLPAEAFEELPPVKDPETGEMLRQVRLKATGQVLTECKPRLIPIGDVKIQPMEAPKGLIFYLDYKYGVEDPTP